MSTALVIGDGSANVADENTGRPSPHLGYIAAIVRKAFPSDTVKTFARKTGVSLGAANKKVHAQRPIYADELAALLRTDEGFDLLTAIMAGTRPKWWRLVSASMEVREAQRLQAEARARIRRAVRGALDADADLTAAIARAEALSDQDFHRPHLDALGAMARVSDRAVAAASKGARR